MVRRHAFRTHRRSGYSLLELLLALALAVVVMSLIGMSLHTTMRATNSGREDVQQAQIARAILRKIAADVRGAISYEPPDIASLMPSTGSSSGAGGAGGAGGTNAGGTNAGGNGTTGGAAAGANTSGSSASGSGEAGGSNVMTSEVDTGASAAPPPGLSGGANWIEIDLSIPTPPAGYTFQASGSEVAEIESELKTVGYWVDGGLYRREIDRAVTLWAIENGAIVDLQADLTPLATEVLDLSFEYFDGADWLTEWSSVDAGGIPTAIRISIALANPRIADELDWHTLTVALPLGGTGSGSGESSADAATDSASTDGASTNGAGTNGTTGGTP